MAKTKAAAKKAAPKTPAKPKTVRKAPEGSKAPAMKTLNGYEVGVGDPPPLTRQTGKYSFLRELPVGQHVTIPVEFPAAKYRDEQEAEKAKREHRQTLRKQVYSATSNIRKKDKQYAFRVAVVDDAVRVWRIAAK